MSGKKSSGNKKRIFMFIGVMIICVTVCMCAVLAAAFSLITEGVYEFPDESQSQAAPLGEPEEIFALLTRAKENSADTSRTRVSRYYELSVDDDTIETSGGQNEASLLKYVKNDLLSLAAELYPENREGSFGDGFIPCPEIRTEKAYYDEISCAVGKDENGETVDTDKYFINLSVGNDALSKQTANGEIAEKMKEALAEQCKITSENIGLREYSIEAAVNIGSKNFEYITVSKAYHVTLDAEFVGSLSSFGKKEISFDFSVTEKYEYSHVGIAFTEDTVSVASGKSEELSVNAVINDDAEYSVSFASSNENIASVDEMGFVTGVSDSAEPVEITVTLDYLGNTYTDTCLVKVGTAVEKIKISASRAQLAVGESVSLSAKVKPSDATDKGIIWISENESVATVSEDGTVIGVSAGEAVIIAVSNDGHFRESCTVTVSDNVGGGKK